ncbi:MAG: transporter [Alphaproteobacteria bacterium]
MQRAVKNMVVLAGALLALPAHASEVGHLVMGTARPRDFIMPDPGTYYLQYDTYYHSDTYKDRNGNKVSTVNTIGGPVNISVDIDSYTIAPMVAHVTQTKILGADYGWYALQPFGNLGLAASVSTTTSGRAASNNSFGLGDAFLQPVWLGWNLGDNQIAAGYGFYAPDGKYETNGTSNVGLGFWSHQFQLTGAHYFDAQKADVLVGALTYEINERKQGEDIAPGDDMAFNIGFDHMMPVNPHWLADIGLMTYGQWQTTDDRGTDAVNPGVHDQVYGIGLNAGLVYLPWMGNIDMHWTHELEARDRLEGDYYTLTLSIPM